jgi:WXG100 family type VII secretion target
MTHGFRLDPDGFDRLALALDLVQAQDYQRALAGLRHVDGAIAAAWQGASSTTFQRLHGGWIEAFERLGHDLPAIAVFLRATADEYRQLDQARRAALFAAPTADRGGQLGDERRASGANSVTDSPGGAGNEPNIPVIKTGRLPAFTAQQAQEIYEWVKGYIWDPANPNARFSWAYTPDGCYARAEVMNHIIQERFGVEPWKVWAFDPTSHLNPDGTYGGVDFGWGYHVATLITVRAEDGTEIPYVIDPSIASEPVTIQAWAALMHAQSTVDLDVTGPGERPDDPNSPFPAQSNYSPASGVPVIYKDGVLVAYSQDLMENLN